MSLVENLINQISTKELGGISKPSGFDMNEIWLRTEWIQFWTKVYRGRNS